jgi:Zn-dependent peptidase ImmA (M78 family)
MPTVNPKILKWARETAALTLEDAAKKLSINESRGISAINRLIALESGTVTPSRPMLVKMAKQYRRPLLVFYMSSPPRIGDRGKDFRTLPAGYSIAENALLDALIRDIRARQSMVRSALETEDEGDKIAFVGSMKISDGVDTVVRSIRNTLNAPLSEFQAQDSVEAAFTWLREKVEAAGVFVLLISNLGSHHTTIDTEIFRGFALADEVAPFVVINDQDSRAAWSFTLIHEIAHLWLGQSGVSGARLDASIEQFCNEVAGQFLLPLEELKKLKIDDNTDFETSINLVSAFAQARNLSSSMVAYRLNRAGVIRSDTWTRLNNTFREQWINWRRQHLERSRDQDGGPNYFVVRRHRVGAALITLVRRMLASGALATTKAGTVLGVRPKNVQTLIDIGHRSDINRLA